MPAADGQNAPTKVNRIRQRFSYGERQRRAAASARARQKRMNCVGDTPTMSLRQGMLRSRLSGGWFLITKRLNDRAASRKPHVAVLRDIFKSEIKILDAMWHPDQK